MSKETKNQEEAENANLGECEQPTKVISMGHTIAKAKWEATCEPSVPNINNVV